MKKGIALSINAMIIVVLGLIVLIVLVIILTGKAGFLGESTTCSARGGDCLEKYPGGDTYSCPSNKPLKVPTEDCKNVNNAEGPGQCCLPLG